MMKRKNILYQLFNTAFPWIPAMVFAGYLYWLKPSILEGILFTIVVASVAFWGWVRSQPQS